MRHRLVLLVALTALLLSACEMQASFRLELEEDGSGKALVVVGLDEEFQSLIEASGEDPEEAFFQEGSPFDEIPGGETRTYTEGDFTFYEAGAPFSDLNAYRALIANDADNPLSELSIEVTEDRAAVEGTVPLDDLTAGAEVDDFEGFSPEALGEFFQLHIQIKMPGKVLEHNAERVLGDGTLEWDIPLVGASDLEILAVSDPSGSDGGFPIWAILLLVILGIAAVVGLLAFLGRNRAPSASSPAEEPAPVGAVAVDEGAAPPPPVTDPPPDPPPTDGTG